MNCFLMQKQGCYGIPFIISLDGHEKIIGRKDISPLVNFPQLSRKHACFQKTPDGKWFVKDLGSLNGTFINRVRIGKGLYSVIPGDTIGFGVPDLDDVEQGFVCVLCACPTKPIDIKQEISNSSENSNLKEVACASNLESVDKPCTVSVVPKTTCDKQCTVSNYAKTPVIKQEITNTSISSENESNSNPASNDIADPYYHHKQTAPSNSRQSNSKSPVQGKENSILKPATSASVTYFNQSVLNFFTNDNDCDAFTNSTNANNVNNNNKSEKHDSPACLPSNKEPFKNELRDESSKYKRKSHLPVICLSSSDESDQISDNRELEQFIKQEVSKPNRCIKKESTEEILPTKKTNQDELKPSKNVPYFSTMAPMDLKENGNASQSKKSATVSSLVQSDQYDALQSKKSATVSPLVQPDQYDELGFSQKEDIIIISDDDDYLDFSSSQVPLNADIRHVNSDFNEDSCGSDLESNICINTAIKTEDTSCNLKKLAKSNCTTNEVSDNNFIKKECTSEENITTHFSLLNSKDINSDTHRNDKTIPSCLDSTKSIEPECNNDQNMNNQDFSVNHEVETSTVMETDRNQPIGNSDVEMPNENELDDNEHIKSTEHNKDQNMNNQCFPLKHEVKTFTDMETDHNQPIESSDVEMPNANKLDDNEFFKSNFFDLKNKSDKTESLPSQASADQDKKIETDTHDALKILQTVTEYSDNSESSEDERPFGIMYPKSVLKQSKLPSKNDARPISDPNTQKKCAKSLEASVQQNTSRPTLLKAKSLDASVQQKTSLRTFESSSSDSSESSEDERPFRIMYPSNSVLNQSKLSSQNTVPPISDPNTQKKSAKSLNASIQQNTSGRTLLTEAKSLGASVQHKTSGRTLLTEAKPMQYRPRTTRGREEWFNEKNNPQETVEDVRQLQIKRKPSPESKKHKKTKLLKKMEKPKNHLKEEIKKQIGYRIPFVKKNTTSTVIHVSQTLSNASPLNERPSNLSIERIQKQSDNEKKNKAPVKKRPEKFGSRMAWLLEDVPKKNCSKTRTEAQTHNKSIHSFNSGLPNQISNAISGISHVQNKGFRGNIPLSGANVASNFSHTKEKQSESIYKNKIPNQPSKSVNNTELAKTTLGARPPSYCNYQNLNFGSVCRDPRLKKMISSNETQICANSKLNSTIPSRTSLHSNDKPQAVISPVRNKECTVKLSFKMNFDYMLEKIVLWPPMWLKEEISISKPPPLVSKGVAKLPLYYDSLDNYVKAFFPMMLLDTWETLFQEYKLICQDGKLVRNRFYFMVSSYCSNGNLMEVNCESIVNPTVSYTPRVGEISILVIREKNTQQAVQVFGYMVRAKNESIQKLDDKWQCLPENWLQNAQICKFSFLTKKKSIDIDKGRVTKAHSLTYVRNKLRLADSIQYLVHSRLTQDILRPREKTFKIFPPKRDKTLLLNSYNASQTDLILAIAEDMRQNYAEPKISMIQGPPGTGKTYTIIGILRHLLSDSRFKMKILVTAPSNAAVDVIGMRLVKLKREGKLNNINFVRVGVKKQIHPGMWPFSLDELALSIHNQRNRSKGRCNQQNLYDIRTRISNLQKEISELLPNQESERKVKEFHLRQHKHRHEVLKKFLEENAPAPRWNYSEEKNCKINILRDSDIILSTLSSCRHPFLESVYGKDDLHFSCCIVDEATQCTEPDVLQPLMFGIHKLILIGDHQQLPATVNSQLAADCYFEKSLYERFHLYFLKHSNQSPIYKLTEQFRMHSEICSFPAKHFYDRMLFTSPSTDITYEVFPLKPYAVFDVLRSQESNASSSKTNISEALVTYEICNYLLSCVPQNCTVGIITPYQGQRDLYIRALSQNPNYKQIEVNTVDGFQGREKDVIILSCVRANSPSGAIGFLSCKKRLNVAITRAKQCLIICGHMKSLQNDSSWASLIDDARSRNVYLPVFTTDEVKILMKKISKLA